MDESIEKDYKPLISELISYSEKDVDQELKDLLIEASSAIESLSDFTINLVDIDGTHIYSIPDMQVKQIMVKAVDSFIQDAINKKIVEVPEDKLLTEEEAEEFEKQFDGP